MATARSKRTIGMTCRDLSLVAELPRSRIAAEIGRNGALRSALTRPRRIGPTARGLAHLPRRPLCGVGRCSPRDGRFDAGAALPIAPVRRALSPKRLPTAAPASPPAPAAARPFNPSPPRSCSRSRASGESSRSPSRFCTRSRGSGRPTSCQPPSNFASPRRCCGRCFHRDRRRCSRAFPRGRSPVRSRYSGGRRCPGSVRPCSNAGPFGAKLHARGSPGAVNALSAGGISATAATRIVGADEPSRAAWAPCRPSSCVSAGCRIPRSGAGYPAIWSVGIAIASVGPSNRVVVGADTPGIGPG